MSIARLSGNRGSRRCFLQPDQSVSRPPDSGRGCDALCGRLQGRVPSPSSPLRVNALAGSFSVGPSPDSPERKSRACCDDELASNATDAAPCGSIAGAVVAFCLGPSGRVSRMAVDATER
jgi:hypothetical protein